MTLTLIHGLACSTRSWERLRPLIGASEAVDLPGHGARAAETGVETIEEMAAAVGPRPGTLVGHSLGALVATAVVEQYPEGVERLVLVNAPPTVASRLTAHSGPERALRTPVLGQLIWRVVPESRVRGGLATAFAPGYEVPDVFVEDVRKLSWTSFVRTTTAVDNYVAAKSLHERVAALNVPVTVVFGEHDQRVDVATLDGYGDDVEIVRIADAGHTPLWETPERVAAVLG